MAARSSQDLACWRWAMARACWKQAAASPLQAVVITLASPVCLQVS
jgi:hypothetical protein